MTASYYRGKITYILTLLGAQGIIIVYAVDDRETFDNVRTWL